MMNMVSLLGQKGRAIEQIGRQPCCDKVGLKKGPWTEEEDQKLVVFLLTLLILLCATCKIAGRNINVALIQNLVLGCNTHCPGQISI
ncbi:uncharacterized protein [Triticum aestivum]|uniref:uncharacterized protein isoform X3 n=1 Tax=Triticum aestivum TaxID=4565 RepID=UPI001D00F93B|nr:uncharacterized protein LOC123053201 isoform X3 [Triticum aestivum]